MYCFWQYGTWWPWYGQFKVGWLQPLQLWLSAVISLVATVREGNTLLPVEDSTNSLGCGGTRTSHSRSTSVCQRHSARMLSTSSEWLLIWSGEEIETHFWCCTGPFFAPSWTTVALCMAKRQTPIYDNWTASMTRDWCRTGDKLLSEPVMFQFTNSYMRLYALMRWVATALCSNVPSNERLMPLD